MSKIARGRFGSNLLTATYKNKAAKHMANMYNNINLRHLTITLLLFERRHSAFAH